MHARHPDLYRDATCCVCDIQDEDNHHLWTCSAIHDVHLPIWEEALGLIPSWGLRETRSYNKKQKEQYERNIRNGKPNIQRPVPVQWSSPTMEQHYQGLSCIGGTQSLLRGEGVYDRSPDLQWRIPDLYRSITPIPLMKEWSKVFTTPKSIAYKVIHQFVGYLEKKATELIWKPRCKATIAKEHEQGITAKQKKAKYTGPRGDWSDGYGYICEEGYCPCGSLLDVHIDGQCPGPSLNPHAADKKLLESYRGLRRLATMGMGRTPYF